ncbi:MAG: 50S ribosomal protein L7/L12 [Candidatus Magasanikbacteria bacterium GW2011_GWA2_45_39]|uniref:50S ribosomal protein L7/L12 n=2 Tax=Candidatus Magasanikiibacteriota TaxID=1752731 RepID=A0A0G1N1H8_9BACT|nr:MAG: 50S ribosomal protein L7/L12 [Candidatus Magasanikbacteria bacterium GW2011_GWA2_45_39]KKU14182.1 MAG: 50S ribosomal protein L7/L12 [Candidatus Magasanikbacteria bacterium GW2011_GWC2_45_8]HBW74028.1 hypothetical protein [Candidatus Magasanikbacteria bacterium]
MDQNQSSWQPISNVLDQKLTGEELIPSTPQASEETLPITPLNNTTSISPQNLALLEKLVNHLTEVSASLSFLIAQIKGTENSSNLPPLPSLLSQTTTIPEPALSTSQIQKYSTDSSAARVLEGVFDGTRMVGADGAVYPVPPNYASKSKLVEGDLMKLTITSTGAFIYKQIGPIKRRRIIGELIKHQDGDTTLYDVLAQDHVYHVLSAAITYYKGEQGDEVAILVPESSPSKWGAVEYVVKKTPSQYI